jgi:hypothetical protein
MNCTLTNGDLVRYLCAFLPMPTCATVSNLSAFLHTTLSTFLRYHISLVDTHTWKEELIYMFAKLWKNTRRSQLSFDIQSYYYDDYIDATLLEGVHTVHLRHCCNTSNLLSLSNAHTVHLSDSDELTDVSSLGGVYTLHLSDCDKITDVFALGRVHTLTLTRLQHVTNVSALGGVHTLTINNLNGVTNVSALGLVHTLELDDCAGITDVSALGNVHTLRLLYCDGITDVSALGSVHTLSLLHCDEVTDVSALGSVHTLQLNDLGQIRSSVSALGKVHTLHISIDSHGRGEEIDVSALGSVHTLTLCGFPDVIGLYALSQVHTLTLRNCRYFNIFRFGSSYVFLGCTFTFNSLTDGTINISLPTTCGELIHTLNIVDYTQLTIEFMMSWARARWWHSEMCVEINARTPL